MNIQGNRRKLVTATVTAALALGLAGGAWAQSNDTTGGNTTDTTSAGNDNGGGMPQIQQQGDVSFVSGGVGSDESKALQHAESRWPLALRFTGPGSDFLADVHVQIVDSHGSDVLHATSRGPYMLVKLRPGHYIVHARYESTEQQRSVTVPASGNTKAAFYWNHQ
jgi:hypothetical protein